MGELKVGDFLEIELDDDNVWTGEWITCEVKNVSVQHNPGKELRPYICVDVSHPKLACFNYSMYCELGRVKRIKKQEPQP